MKLKINNYPDLEFQVSGEGAVEFLGYLLEYVELAEENYEEGEYYEAAKRARAVGKGIFKALKKARKE